MLCFYHVNDLNQKLWVDLGDRNAIQLKAERGKTVYSSINETAFI